MVYHSSLVPLPYVLVLCIGTAVKLLFFCTWHLFSSIETLFSLLCDHGLDLGKCANARTSSLLVLQERHSSQFPDIQCPALDCGIKYRTVRVRYSMSIVGSGVNGRTPLALSFVTEGRAPGATVGVVYNYHYRTGSVRHLKHKEIIK